MVRIYKGYFLEKLGIKGSRKFYFGVFGGFFGGFCMCMIVVFLGF